MTRGTASHLFCSFLFFVASFWLQKKLFGKTFWNKVVKKKRCGRSYWRCQDVILCKIKILSRIALVVRRVGGLEVLSARLRRLPEVVRRVGGLEVYGLPGVDDGLVVRRVGGLEAPEIRLSATVGVVRRVGGLEVLVLLIWLSLPVVRRVGGLEGVGGITCESSAIDEETEAR